METAEPLARARQLSIRTCEAANEFGFGEWTGKTWKDLEPLCEWRRFNSFRSATPAPGGELMLDVQARIVREMDALRQEHPGQHLALFTHGDVIRAAVMHFAGIPIDLLHRIEISTASISTISLDEQGARILMVNRTVDL